MRARPCRLETRALAALAPVCAQLAGEMKAKGIERNVHTYTVSAARARRRSCRQGAGAGRAAGAVHCLRLPAAAPALPWPASHPLIPTHPPAPQALMNVCIKCSKHSLALDTYKLMRQDRCTPNVVT